MGTSLLAACMLLVSGLATERATTPVHMGMAGAPTVEFSTGDSRMPGPDRRAATRPGTTAPGTATPHPRQFAMAPQTGSQATSPDSHARMMQQRATDHAVAMARETEAALELSAAGRREVQRRLQLAGYTPEGVDGIFGASTRAAITAWQRDMGQAPPSGFVSEEMLQQLGEKTDDAYLAWHKARAAQRRVQLASAPTPAPRPTKDDECARRNSGKIVYGQNFNCDIQGLGESLDNFGDKISRLLSSADTQTLSPRRHPVDEA